MSSEWFFWSLSWVHLASVKDCKNGLDSSMTEYAASTEVYLTAHERCARWVQTHSFDRDGFYSPSVPPMEIEGFIPSSSPSDAGSSHSLPPKMVLRYPDGRPDIPIPHVTPSLRKHERDSRNPPSEPPYHQRSHTNASSRSHPRQTSSVTVHSSHQHSHGYTSHHEPFGANADSPEEIRILPSQASVPNQLPPRSVSSHRQRPHHYHSESLSQTRPNHIYEGDDSQSRPIVYPPPSSRHFDAAPQINAQERPTPWHGLHTHSSSSSTKHSHGLSNHRISPATVYVPQHGYAPPYPPSAILYHPPPPQGPNGMIYSHSAPVPIQGGSHRVVMPQGDIEYRKKTRSSGRVHRVLRSDDGQKPDTESVGSQSTYYVLPTSGQKMHMAVCHFHLLYLLLVH